jgi:hypothetical protein
VSYITLNKLLSPLIECVKLVWVLRPKLKSLTSVYGAKSGLMKFAEFRIDDCLALE